MRRPRFTMRWLVAAILLAGVGLGVVASERWRWGYPRRLWFDEGTAVRRLATAIRADRRMYDPGDLHALLDLIIARREFLGATEGQILARLGLSDRSADPRLVDRKPGMVSVRIGVVDVGMLDGEEWIEFHLDGAGKCAKVTQSSCC